MKKINLLGKMAIASAIALGTLGFGASQTRADELEFRFNQNRNVIEAFENGSYETDIEGYSKQINGLKIEFENDKIFSVEGGILSNVYDCNKSINMNSQNSIEDRDAEVARISACRYANTIRNSYFDKIRGDNLEDISNMAIRDIHNYKRRIDEYEDIFGGNNDSNVFKSRDNALENLGKNYD